MSETVDQIIKQQIAAYEAADTTRQTIEARLFARGGAHALRQLLARLPRTSTTAGEGR